MLEAWKAARTQRYNEVRDLLYYDGKPLLDKSKFCEAYDRQKIEEVAGRAMRNYAYQPGDATSFVKSKPPTFFVVPQAEWVGLRLPKKDWDAARERRKAEIAYRKARDDAKRKEQEEKEAAKLKRQEEDAREFHEWYTKEAAERDRKAAIQKGKVTTENFDQAMLAGLKAVKSKRGLSAERKKEIVTAVRAGAVATASARQRAAEAGSPLVSGWPENTGARPKIPGGMASGVLQNAPGPSGVVSKAPQGGPAAAVPGPSGMAAKAGTSGFVPAAAGARTGQADQGQREIVKVPIKRTKDKLVINSNEDLAHLGLLRCNLLIDATSGTKVTMARMIQPDGTVSMVWEEFDPSLPCFGTPAEVRAALTPDESDGAPEGQSGGDQDDNMGQ